MAKTSADKDRNNGTGRKRRVSRTFPACPFEEALELPMAIQEHASGEPIRRLTLFDELDKSPESGPSRQLVTNANKYGLINGNYSSEYLELTEQGRAATSEESTDREKARARVKLAIQDIPPFNTLHERFAGNKLPSRQVLIDELVESGLDISVADEAVDTFVVNAKFVGLLKTLSGAERVLSVDHFLDQLPSKDRQEHVSNQPLPEVRGEQRIISPSDDAFATTCFYITPIGSEDSEFRMHSDLFLSSVVEPAVEPLGLNVVRADAIDKPGLITKQVIEYLLKSRLVIADLSYHNPNVFYELAIRHAARLPTVQITRQSDRIPFDINQNRTIHIDTSSIYSLVPQLDTYKSEIANQARRALEDPDALDNPITLFWPNLKVSL